MSATYNPIVALSVSRPDALPLTSPVSLTVLVHCWWRYRSCPSEWRRRGHC